MKAIVFDGDHAAKLTDVPEPDLIDARDALVRITHSSICGSDIGILKGKIVLQKGEIMGHEGVGVIEKVGPGVTKVKPGDRVVMPFSVQCGECDYCKSGWPIFCQRGGMLGHGKQWGDYGGTQAEYLRLPWADVNCHPIPASLTEEQALFVGDILSTGYQACEYGSIQPGDVVVVFGAGPVGLCAVATARLFGPRKIVSVDLVDYRLEAAKRLGADVVLNAGRANVPEEIKAMTDGKGANVAIEAVGTAQTFEGCIQSVGPTGRISIVGVFPFEKVGISLRDMLRRTLQIRAGRANFIHMDRLLSLIESGKLDVSSLITHRMPLGDAEKAYELFVSKSANVLKIILTA